MHLYLVLAPCLPASACAIEMFHVEHFISAGGAALRTRARRACAGNGLVARARVSRHLHAPPAHARRDRNVPRGTFYIPREQGSKRSVALNTLHVSHAPVPALTCTWSWSWSWWPPASLPPCLCMRYRNVPRGTFSSAGGAALRTQARCACAGNGRVARARARTPGVLPRLGAGLGGGLFSSLNLNLLTLRPRRQITCRKVSDS